MRRLSRRIPAPAAPAPAPPARSRVMSANQIRSTGRLFPNNDSIERAAQFPARSTESQAQRSLPEDASGRPRNWNRRIRCNCIFRFPVDRSSVVLSFLSKLAEVNRCDPSRVFHPPAGTTHEFSRFTMTRPPPRSIPYIRCPRKHPIATGRIGSIESGAKGSNPTNIGNNDKETLMRRRRLGNPDPLIKSQIQSGRNNDNKVQLFRGQVDFSSTMEACLCRHKTSTRCP